MAKFPLKHQVLREIFKITEWRDGCVYKTRSVGWAWITEGFNPPNDGNLQFVSPSTTVMRALNFKTIRSVSMDTPDMDITTKQVLGVK